MIKFKQWLETNGMMEASPEEVTDAQMLWLTCYDVLHNFNNDMNAALVAYCLSTPSNIESPEELGKKLGILLVHSSHYTKKRANVDRHEIVKQLIDQGKEKGKKIATAALKAYSMYEMRPFTVNTIKMLG